MGDLRTTAEERATVRGAVGAWQHDDALAPAAPAEPLIREECAALADMLVAKNAAYGNSALEPLRVFSRASAEEQIFVRLDDKLSRLARGSAAGEDVVLDLLGYLILLRVQRRLVNQEASTPGPQ